MFCPAQQEVCCIYGSVEVVPQLYCLLLYFSRSAGHNTLAAVCCCVARAAQHYRNNRFRPTKNVTFAQTTIGGIYYARKNVWFV